MPLDKDLTTMNSNDSLLSGLNNTFTSNLSKKLANAMRQHSSLQFKWLKQIETIKKIKDRKDINITYARRKLNKSLSKKGLGTLLERQASYELDEEGSKKPSTFWQHKSPKRDVQNPANLQKRVNGFYQSCRGSDVAYVTTHTKNPKTMLWSTSPTNRQGRGAA